MMDGIPSASSSSPSRSSNSRFKTLPVLHPHEVELRVNVKELSRPIAPEKFRSKTQSVGGFVFGLLVFPQGTKSAPEHARKNRGDEDDKNSKKGEEPAKKQRWISAFVEARPSEDYPASWCFSDVQFLVSLINYEEVARSIVKHDKHTFSPTESSDGKAIDRGWHDFVSCDEQTLRESGFVDSDDHVCFRASVYLAGGPMKVTTSKTKRYLELQHVGGPLYCNSMVQAMFHLGLLRTLIYGESNPNVGRLSYGSPKGEMTNWKNHSSGALYALRDVFYKLQMRTSQVVSCKDFPQIEGNSLDTWFTAFYNHLLSAMCPDPSDNTASKRKSKKEQMNRAEQLRDLLEFDIHWSGRDAGKQGKTMELTYRGPLFSLLIRGFSDLETCLMHYFAKKRVLNSGDGTCTARRLIRSLPPIVMWHLKRGEYDPEGIPDTYFEFPRRIDMSRYVERRDDADLNFVLYAVVVEVEPSVGHERRYYAFLRPEMEGDKGQWYRFDDGPVNSVHAVSNATAMDASLGGEEWLCVNYLYGPGSVLTRPKSSRACLLCYIRETDAAQLLKEPRLPKNKDKKVSEMRARSPMSAADEIANMRAESLIEELEQQELREQKKKQQKQKKKHKEKVKRKTVDKEESVGSQLEQTAMDSMSAVDSDSDVDQNSVLRASSKNNTLLAQPSGKKGRAVASTSAASGSNAKKRSKQQNAHTPSAGSSSSPVPDGVDAEWKHGSSAPLSSKRKEHPATPSLGSTPVDSGGKNSIKQQTAGNNAIVSKELERMKHRNATGAATVGSAVASSSSAIGSRVNAPSVALTKKERKKKAAAEQAAHKDHPSTPAVGSTASSCKEETSNGKPPDTSTTNIVGKAHTPSTAASRATPSSDTKKLSVADDKKGPQSGAQIGESHSPTFSPDIRTSAGAQHGVPRATTNVPAVAVKPSSAPKQQPAKAPSHAELLLASKETRPAKRVINANATGVDHVVSDSRTPPTSHTSDVRASNSTAPSSSSPRSKTQNGEAWIQKTDASMSFAARAVSNAAVASLPKAKSAQAGVSNAVLSPKKLDESKNHTEAKNPVVQQQAAATPAAKAAPIVIGAPKLPPPAKASPAVVAQAQVKALTTSYATRGKASSGPNIAAKSSVCNVYGKASSAAIQTRVPVGAKSARVLPDAQGQTSVRPKGQGPAMAQMLNAPKESSASVAMQEANTGNAGGMVTQSQPQSSHPSCSSSAEPGGWYPHQLLVDDASARIQFECQVCHRIVRNPVVLECAHLFCRGCLVAHGKCPTCQVTYGELVCLEQTRGGALALLHRVYSGLKLRCLYHPDSRDQPWEELKGATQTCEWRGFLQDYAKHLKNCAAHHATLKMPLSELGEMQLSVDWTSEHTNPPIEVKAGSVFHISSFDESKQWAYAFTGTASGALVGWLPGNILERKVYIVTYPYCATDGASGENDCPNSEFISMELGQRVAVYHRQGNGWVYGATISGATAGQVGWFPERCIA